MSSRFAHRFWVAPVAVMVMAASVVVGTPQVASAATTVVPSAQATSTGDGGQSYPFDCGNFAVSAQRYQQVYKGSEVGSGTITQIAFRPGTFSGSAFGPTTIPNVTITMSTTSKPVDGLSLTFASNVGSDVTTVYSGNLTLSSAKTGGPPPVPFDFDIVINLQHSFTFNAGAGNLLFDVTVPTCGKTTPFDAIDATGDSVSRVYTFVSGSGAATADGGDTSGLITRFTSSPVTTVCSGSGSAGSGTSGGAGGTRVKKGGSTCTPGGAGG